MRLMPMAPPGPKGAIPTVAEKLPLMPGDGVGLRKLVKRALRADVSAQDMEVICYLMRRAYGEGYGEALRRRG